MHFIRPYTFIYLPLQKQSLSGHLSIIFNPDQISFFFPYIVPYLNSGKVLENNLSKSIIIC